MQTASPTDKKSEGAPPSKWEGKSFADDAPSRGVRPGEEHATTADTEREQDRIGVQVVLAHEVAK